ncbi:MAG: DUF2784 domain-containing protein [Actinomycetota bacterium]|nr:DUF2784 domain-containing protein [Actinomycetota bacterium]MDQ3573514.1 DUF2784 domain-containing protein [Actinomycetota bacterium]
MLYRILADSVVVLHFAFILFVGAGALLAWRWPRLAWAHLPSLLWGVGSLTIGLPCPLTTLEQTMLRWGGAMEYEGGFVDRYVEDVIYPQQYSSALHALAVVMIVAGYVGLRRRSAPPHTTPVRDRHRHRTRLLGLVVVGEAGRGSWLPQGQRRGRTPEYHSPQWKLWRAPSPWRRSSLP